MSRISCTGLLGNALMFPFVVGTIAMLDVTHPSTAFNVATVGCVAPCGQSVKYPSGPGGTTVALNTCAWAVDGTPHPLSVAATGRTPLNGGLPEGWRLSSTRQGGTL